MNGDLLNGRVNQVQSKLNLRRAGLTRLATGLLVVAWMMLAGSPANAQRQSATFSQLSKKAAEARDSDRLDEAVGLYKKALTLRPKWEDGWWGLGTLEYDQDHYPQAARAFERLLAVNPVNGTAHAMLGLCQSELGQDESGLKHLLAAEKLGVVKDEQLRKVALFHMGMLQLRTRRFSAARQTLSKLASEKVETKELTTALGWAGILVRPQDAPSEGTDGVRIVQRVGLAEALLARKDFAGAKDIYAQLAKDSPEFPNLHLAFGRCLLDASEIDEAVAEFQRELSRAPQDTNSMLEIAAARYQSDSKDGLKYAEEAVKLAPGVPFGHYILGLLRLDTGDAAGAIPELEAANKALPSEASVYFSLGRAYASVGRKADAVKARAEFARLNAKEHPADESGKYNPPKPINPNSLDNSATPSRQR